MRLTNTVARGAALAGLGFALSRVISLVTLLVLARLITPRDAGIYAAGSVLFGLGVLFVDSGTTASLIQWRGDVDRAASTAVASTFVGGVLFALVALAVAPLVGSYFHSDDIARVSAVASGFLFLRALQIVPDALLQRRFSFVRRVAIDPLGAVAYGATAVSLAANGAGFWSMVVGTYAALVVQTLAGWGLVRWRPRLRQMSLATWRQLASFGRHVLAAEFVRNAAAQVDTVLLGRLAGIRTLGQYRYGLRIADVVQQSWVSVAAYVLLPAFARIAEDGARLRDAFRRSLQALCFLAFPVSLLLLPLGQPIALLVLGDRWREAGHVMMALALYPAGMVLISLASEIFKAVGRPQLLTRVHTGRALLSVALLVPVAALGAIAISLAVSAAALIVGGWAIFLAAREVGVTFRDALSGVVPVVVGCLVMVATVLPLEVLVIRAGEKPAATGFPLLGAEALLGLASYALALRVIAPDLLRRMRTVVRSVRS
jgi:PST family polysaccharide transporter